MNKVLNIFSIGLCVLMFFILNSGAYADMAPFPGNGGGFPTNSNGDDTALIAIGVGVGIVALISWFVIRRIKKN